MWYGSSISTFTCSYFFHFQVRHGWYIQSPNKVEYINRHPKFNMFINELLLLPTISPSPWVSPYLCWWQHHPSTCSNQKKKRERERWPWFLFFYLTHCNHIQFIWKPTSFTSKHTQAFITFPTSWFFTIKIARRNINNLRHADDTTLMAESEDKLKSLLMKVKVESEKVGLKLNSQKTKIMASGPTTSWEIDRGNSGNSVRLYFGGLQNHCRWWLQP